MRYIMVAVMYKGVAAKVGVLAAFEWQPKILLV